MKLEKREITLNEADSLQDMLYMETLLLQSYEKGLAKTTRKETQAFFAERIKELRKEVSGIEGQIKNI